MKRQAIDNNNGVTQSSIDISVYMSLAIVSNFFPINIYIAKIYMIQLSTVFHTIFFISLMLCIFTAKHLKCRMYMQQYKLYNEQFFLLHVVAHATKRHKKSVNPFPPIQKTFFVPIFFH